MDKKEVLIEVKDLKKYFQVGRKSVSLLGMGKYPKMILLSNHYRVETGLLIEHFEESFQQNSLLILASNILGQLPLVEKSQQISIS